MIYMTFEIGDSKVSNATASALA